MAVPYDPIAPDGAFCVIGDIHGRFDLLQLLVGALPKGVSIMSVGDMIDRGAQSADVLRFVKDHSEMSALMGNHEAMMLAFLSDPETNGSRWIRNGGLQTLTSFGISGATETANAQQLRDMRDALFNAMGDDLVTWVSGLEHVASSGNVVVVHAGADPDLPLTDQTADTFIWGHPQFHKKPRSDGFWIVHGHTIFDTPKLREGRISIDTGAYATGQLTAAVFSKDGVEFVTT
ncbi:metallophosphoesterase [Marivita sp. S0852]|uniref:metallophosphoesterase n=1 Tax=Marivita sp. S0852 TaxID=3373893 RepID=UPI003982365A